LSIDVVIIVGVFPYGNPGSLGEPLGLFTGAAAVTGDATGGFVRVRFAPQNPTDTPLLADQRRQYVYFLDGYRITGSVDGVHSVSITCHWARSNSALATPFTHKIARASVDDGINLFYGPDLMSDRMTRTPIFWDTQELAGAGNGIVDLAAETNTNAANYRFECYGRYYDRQILSNRSFGRLISPSAVSQFA